MGSSSSKSNQSTRSSCGGSCYSRCSSRSGELDGSSSPSRGNESSSSKCRAATVLWELYKSVKPTAAQHMVKRQFLNTCTATLEAIIKKDGVPDTALCKTAGYAASAAEFERVLDVACANSSTPTGIAAAIVEAATAAMGAYASVTLESKADAEALVAEAAAVVAAGHDGQIWEQFGAGSWCQVLASLHLDLVKVKLEQKQLLGGWAGAEGEERSWWVSAASVVMAGIFGMVLILDPLSNAQIATRA